MESFALHSLSTTTTSSSFSSLSTRTSFLIRSTKPISKSSPSIFSPHCLPAIRSHSLSFSPKLLPLSPLHNKPFKIHFPIHASSPNNDPSTLPAITTSPPPPPQGAKLLPLIISVSIGLIVRFCIPKPVEVTQQAWQLLAIFLSTIAGLVLSPLPVGAWAFLGLTTSIVTRTLAFSTAFSAFTSKVIWLIVILSVSLADLLRLD